MQRFVFSLFLLSLVSLSADHARAQLFAVNGNGTPGTSGELFTVGRFSGAATEVGALGFAATSALAYDPNSSTLYGFGGSGGVPGKLLVIDVTTGESTTVGASPGVPITGMAFDPNADVLYAASINFPGSLYSVDTTTGVFTLIGSGQRVVGLAFDPITDTLYGTYGVPSSLYSIDTATGASTLIGPTGSSDIQGLTFDRLTNTLFGADRLTSELLVIDVATGAATVVGSLGGTPELRGLASGPDPDCDLDQSQPSHPNAMAGFSQTDLAQSFTPERSVICGASVHLFESLGTSGDVTIELWDRLPNDGGHLLRSGTAVGALPGTWATVVWPAVMIDVTRQYFLVFRSDSDLAIDGTTSDAYPGGVCYANPGFQAFPGFDYAFKTFAEPCKVDQAMTRNEGFCTLLRNDFEVAQSFVPAQGSISGAGAIMASGSGGTGDVTIELWDDLPGNGGTLLASGTQTGVGDDDAISVEWARVSVTPGATYFLVFSGTDETQCLGGSCDDSYPDGSAWTNGTRWQDCDFAFETYSCDACDLDCMAGNVNQTAEVVLTVNGEHSADGAWVHAPVDGPITASIVKPSAGGNGKFLVHASWGAPTSDTVVSLPGQIGDSCFDLLIVAGGGSATPAAIWNNIGKTDKVGSSTGFDGSPIPDPERAPADFLSLPAGDATNLPVGMLFTLQGVIIDPNTGANKPVSLTNTVIVTVE